MLDSIQDKFVPLKEIENLKNPLLQLALGGQEDVPDKTSVHIELPLSE